MPNQQLEKGKIYSSKAHIHKHNTSTRQNLPNSTLDETEDTQYKKTEVASNTLLKNILMPVSAHVSPAPPGFGRVGLQMNSIEELQIR